MTEKDTTTYNELRTAFATLTERDDALVAMVARIEATITAAQALLYDRMAEIATSLREISIFSDDMRTLQDRLEESQRDRQNIHEEEKRIENSLKEMAAQLTKIKALEKKINKGTTLYYLMFAMITAILLIIGTHAIGVSP